MKLRRAFRAALGALAAAACASCGGVVGFNSPAALSNGVNSKGWNYPYFVDSGLYLPGQLRFRQTVRSFDETVSGGTIQIAATLFDTGSGKFLGFTRQYTDPLAWAPLGNGFTATGSFGTDNAGEISVALGPGGMLLQTIFDGTGTGSIVTAESSAGAWTSVSSSGTTRTANATTTGDLAGTQPDVATAFDPLGRAYAFWINSGGALILGNWQAGNQVPGVGMGFASGAIAGASPVAGPIDALWDGARFVCATYEVGAAYRALKSTCIDTTKTPVDGTAAITATITASGAQQHAMATDGAGGFVTVFHKQSGGALHVYASAGTFTTSGPTWSTPTQIDSGVGSTLVAPDTSAASTTGAAPGVAYLGNGNYVAVWVEMTTPASSGLGTGQNYTALYSSVYLAGSGWSAPATISNTLDYYYSVPHPRSLHVFGGNGANGISNNAGFALDAIYNQTCGNPLKGVYYTNASTGAAGCIDDEVHYYATAWCYPASSLPPQCTVPTPVAGTWSPLHALWVNRFQINNGWLTTYSPNNQYGSKCQPVNDSNPSAPSSNAPDGTAITQSFCSVRPKGAILPSGDTVVLFQNQDNDGNFRLGGIEFR